jgi:hypothetical protein
MTAPPENRTVPELPPPRHPWAWPAAWVCVTLIFAGSCVFIFNSLRNLPVEAASRTSTALAHAGRQLSSIAAAFQQHTVTTSFLSYATHLTPGQFFQFANLRQTEIFSQTDEATTAFGYLPLPGLVVEARAPVEYTYYLDLNDRWELQLEDGILYVLAPSIRYNKPSVDASRIEYEVRKNSLFRDGEHALESLKKSITPLVSQRARENLPLVRELGRRQTEEFVENWLAKSFQDGNRVSARVFFPEETLPAVLEQLAPRR